MQQPNFVVHMSQPQSLTCLVKLGTQYGQRVIHPADETSRLFAELAGSKTLTPRTIELIKKLGYTVNVVQDLPTEL